MAESLFAFDETAIERGPGRPGRYILADGSRVPSVTTITGRFKDSSGLLRWAHQRGLDGHTELYDDAALTIGSVVHATIEAEVNGEPLPAVPEEYQAQVESALAAWHEWWLSSQLSVVATEIPLISEEHKFGGTIDTIVRDRRGRLALGDWKSSKAVYSDYLLQMAAYRLLWNENREEPLTGGFHLVRFSKEHGDMEHRHYPDLAEAEHMFLFLREAYALDKLLRARAR